MANRQTGLATSVHVKFESTYGTANTTEAIRIPFLTVDAGATRERVNNETRGSGNNQDNRPFRGSKRVNGTIVVPMDFEVLPLWLKAAMGTQTTTGSNAPFSHAFASNFALSDYPSMTIEIGYETMSEYHLITGARIDTISGSIEDGVPSDLTVTFIARNLAVNTSSQITSPVTIGMAREETRFNWEHFGGTLHKGNAVIDFISADFTYSNNLEAFAGPGNQGLISDADPRRRTMGGTITVALSEDNKYLLADSENHVFDSLSLNYGSVDNNANNLLIEMEDVNVVAPNISINDDGITEFPVEYRATGQGANSRMVAARQINSLAGTSYD